MSFYLILAIQNGNFYEQLKKPLSFPTDTFGLSNWLLRFPLTIYTRDLRQKHIFNEDQVTISAHSGPIQQLRWKYFVITQQDGKRLYCTSQVNYQKGILTKFIQSQGTTNNYENQQYYLPKCLVFISDQPYFKMHVNLFRIYRQIRKPYPSFTHPFPPKTFSPRTFGMRGPMENINPHTPPSLQMILEYYLEKCNAHKSGEGIVLQKQSNTPILHLYKIKQNSVFQFSHFFNLPLSPAVIKNALIAILLEKQLIVASKNNNLNVMVIESLLQIIRPLKWEHMLVHNLPQHLLEAAGQNFMPFIVGINKEYINNISTSDKFVLFVDQDRIILPQTLPILSLGLKNFPDQLKNQGIPAHSNEKVMLQYSIQFMCRLLQPITKNRNIIPSKNQDFYNDFTQKTTLWQTFLQKYDSGQLRQFARILSIQDEQQRQIQIQKKLNQLFYYFQNPKFIDHQSDWIDYYLNYNHPKPPSSEERKLLTLRQIKQSIINEVPHQNLHRKLAPQTKERSSSTMHSHARPGRSGQKLKVSVVRHERCHPLLNELLQQKLGIITHFG